MLVLAPLLVASAHAGAVGGTLWMSREAQMRAQQAPATAGRAQQGVLDGVVWLDEIPAKLERKLATPPHGLFQKPKPVALPRVMQSERQFRPRVTAVAAGAHILFSNADRFYHNAFSVSKAKRFDLGKYPPGRSDTVVFNRSGVINLHCDIHPDMLGFIVVTPNHAFVRPDSLGRFGLPKLPPGHYVLRAWHPRRGELKREFEVPSRGDVDLELRF